MSDQVLARVSATGPRRVFGVAVMGTLGLLLVYLSFVAPPQNFAYRLVLILLGFGSLWVTARMWQVTQHDLELTKTELRLSDGTTLALNDDIQSIDRGMFAFKPSHGFMLKLASPGRKAWHPGLWWRLGKRLGVGGVTPGAQTKMMADMISAMLAEREN